MKSFLIRINQILAGQFGFDPRRFLQSVRGLPAFFRDWWQFRKAYEGHLVWMPCLHDRYQEGGDSKSEYFWQDLLVAQAIYARRPEKHVDIGSRVDGFVAHVASFREIEVFDIRPIATVIPGVVFRQADLMRGLALSNVKGKEYCDSLSCLHALEHFGLGRYGDSVDPKGHEKGFANMADMLKPGGIFYLSIPIGWERVEFNAHRVFDPLTVLRLAEFCGLALLSLTVISNSGVPISRQIKADLGVLCDLAKAPYHLGIFTFLKAKAKL